MGRNVENMVLQLDQELRKEFENKIVPFCIRQATQTKGVAIAYCNLWIFGAAYRLLNQEKYLNVAASLFIRCLNRTEIANSQIPILSLAVNALSQYFRITNDSLALEYAIELYLSIEKQNLDIKQNVETHLLILGAYPSLYEGWKNDRLKERLRMLVKLFLENLFNEESGHLRLSFNDKGKPTSHSISYGYDIEASWLIHKAVVLLNDKALLHETEPIVEFMAAAAGEGLRENGSIRSQNITTRKHCSDENLQWMQAENVVGHFNLYQHFGDEIALQKAYRAWEYIKKNLTQREENGELWKYLYHNGRMCVEIMERCAIVKESTHVAQSL